MLAMDFFGENEGERASSTGGVGVNEALPGLGVRFMSCKKGVLNISIDRRPAMFLPIVSHVEGIPFSSHLDHCL